MSRGLTTFGIAAALGMLASATALANPTPSSGTLSPLTPHLAFADGPFTGANPSNDVPGSNGPNCSALPNSCSDYTLTVSIPVGYTALHPQDVITVTVQWPEEQEGVKPRYRGRHVLER